LTGYYIRRFLAIIPMIWIIITITFLLAHAAPGDPISKMYGHDLGVAASEQELNAIRDKYGLNRPLIVQYLEYMGLLVRGNLGQSITIWGGDVRQMIFQVLPISMQLGASALVLLFLIGIPMGILAALKRNTWVDYAIVGTSLGFNSIPVFILAPLLFIILVINLKLMPKIPYGWDGLFSYKNIIPVVLLALGPMAGVIRQTRSGMLEVLSEDYVRTAKAKGLGSFRIIVQHVMRNAMLPVVTSGGMIMTGLLTGSLFIDVLFGIPGFGRLSAQAVINFDYAVILGCTLFSSLMVILANLLTDFIYPILDPRIVHGKRHA
jgi:peptide/nickel transport system permease protein